MLGLVLVFPFTSFHVIVWIRWVRELVGEEEENLDIMCRSKLVVAIIFHT